MGAIAKLRFKKKKSYPACTITIYCFTGAIITVHILLLINS